MTIARFTFLGVTAMRTGALRRAVLLAF